MEEDVSLDIKEWMSEVKKPRSMSVQDFFQRLNHLNDLIEYTPIPDPTNNPGKQTPKFTDAKLSRIVKNACPTGWKKAQVQANLRRGYYHFELDNTSKLLCGIILPWGRYVYNCLSQGCMPSSDIFQGHMTKCFYDFEAIIVYIDNIILFTKSSFEHHVQRLSLVLNCLQANNLHVHLEETFLAIQEVDYLVYTLSSKGIKSQNKKILALLAFAEPKNKRQLRSFLGFVNFYSQLWYHRSHFISPLTNITSDKSKWTWVPAQQQAFKNIWNTIARQVLLKYPDVTKPFDVYTDASNFQLGAIISQNNWPIAFTPEN